MAKSRRPVNGDYSAKLRAIRRYVDFDYDLRKPLAPSQKRKIARYAEALREISARSNKVYRSQDIRRVREVQKLSRNEFENLPGFRVAFVESPEANPVKVRLTKKGKPRLVAQFFEMGFIPFNPRGLAESPEDETKRAMSQSPSKFFRVSTGKFSIATAFDRNILPGEVAKLVSRYDVDAKDPTKLAGGKSLNHHYSRWLNGVISLEVKNQSDLEDFLRRDVEAKRQRKARKRHHYFVDSRKPDNCALCGLPEVDPIHIKRRAKAKTDNGMR